MPTRQRVAPRTPEDRLLDLTDGGARIGYAVPTIRKMIRGENPPPFFKVRGKWFAWQSDLDAWVTSHQDQAS